ncbi:MAG: GlsB/YeaQ/YmgE family stress response membrane protein [Verrucomicrobiota bacterium]
MDISTLTLLAVPNLVFWIIIGIAAGALARFLLPGEQKMNIFLTMILGLAGAFIGGYLTQSVIKSEAWWMTLLVSTAGAFVLLIVFEMLGKFKK